VLYYKSRHCLTPRRAAARWIPKKKTFWIIFKFYHSQVCAWWQGMLLLHAQAQRCAKPTPIMPTVGITSACLSIVASTHTGLEGSSVEAFFVMVNPRRKDGDLKPERIAANFWTTWRRTLTSTGRKCARYLRMLYGLTCRLGVLQAW